MLHLDAVQDAPEFLIVLTAREFLTRADCYGHLRQLRKALRRTWPAAEWAVLVEFQRRGALHLNLLLKGVPEGAQGGLQSRIEAFWTSRVDAEPWAQSVTNVYDGGGVIRYLAHHFNKPAQAPPIGWRGHRFSCTRGYWHDGHTTAEMRELAKRSLREKRALWRGVPEELVGLEMELEDLTTWELWQVDHKSAVMEPIAQVSSDKPRRADREPLRAS